MVGVADNGQLAPIPSSLRRAQHRYRRSSTGTGVAADAPSNWSARYSYLLTAVAGMLDWHRARPERGFVILRDAWPRSKQNLQITRLN